MRVPALVTDSSGLPETRAFIDAVLLNYDVRELKDDSGNIVLYYSFPTPNLLVIAENPSTFAEVLSRLEAQRELVRRRGAIGKSVLFDTIQL